MFLLACDKSKDFNEAELTLLAIDSESLALYTIGDEITYDQLSELGIENVNKFVHSRVSYNDSNEMYPNVQVEKEPAYVVLDSNGVVYKGYDFEELINYLKGN